MKVVINRDWGGFGLSDIALDLLGIRYAGDIQRNDPRLVDVVEKLGKEAHGSRSSLMVVEIPDDMPFYIHDYDGFETIHEEHRVFPKSAGASESKDISPCVDIEYARKLERERDEARNKMADALQEVDLRTLDFERIKQELHAARAEAAKWEAIAFWEANANSLTKKRI